MTVKLSDEILGSIRGLIKEATHFTEDDENFHLCYKYVTSNVCNHRFLSVNSHSVKQSLDNLVLRLRVHGHTANAQRLGKLVSDFVNHREFKDHPQSDVQWSILSLLVNMTGVPTNTTAEAAVESVDEPFDWVAYLREGDVDVHYYSSDTDTDDDWDLSKTEEQEVLPHVVGGSSKSNDGRCPVVSTSTCAGSTAPNKCDLIKQCLLSKEWLANNVQHNWWSSSSISEPGCSYSRLNVAHMWQVAFSHPESSNCVFKASGHQKIQSLKLILNTVQLVDQTLETMARESFMAHELDLSGLLELSKITLEMACKHNWGGLE